MDDESEFKESHYIIKSYPYLIDGKPLVLLRLERLNVEEDDDLPKTYNFLLSLDQTEVLQVDLERSKLAAINEFIKERAMLRELDQELDAWGHEDEKPPEPPADE